VDDSVTTIHAVWLTVNAVFEQTPWWVFGLFAVFAAEWDRVLRRTP
jgi:hypothetical protein